MNPLILLALIKALTQEVQLLELQLSRMQSSSVVLINQPVSSTLENIGYSNPPYIPPTPLLGTNLVSISTTTVSSSQSSFYMPAGAYLPSGDPTNPCGTNTRQCEIQDDCGQPWLSCNAAHQCFCQNPMSNQQ